MIEWVSCPVTYTLQHNGFEIGVHPESPVFRDKTRACISTHPSNGKFVTVKIYKSENITKGFVEINEFLADYLGFIEDNRVVYTHAQLTADKYITFFSDNVTKREKEENNMENKQSVKDDNNMKHIVNNPSFDPSYFIINDAYQVFDRDHALIGNMILRVYQPTCLSFTYVNGDYYNIQLSEYENGDRDFVHLVPENDVSVNDEI